MSRSLTSGSLRWEMSSASSAGEAEHAEQVAGDLVGRFGIVAVRVVAAQLVEAQRGTEDGGHVWELEHPKGGVRSTHAQPNWYSRAALEVTDLGERRCGGCSLDVVPMGRNEMSGKSDGSYFNILGPLEVVHGDELIDLGGTRQRATLGLLLLNPNRVVASGRNPSVRAEPIQSGLPLALQRRRPACPGSQPFPSAANYGADSAASSVMANTVARGENAQLEWT